MVGRMNDSANGTLYIIFIAKYFVFSSFIHFFFSFIGIYGTHTLLKQLKHIYKYIEIQTILYPFQFKWNLAWNS